MAGDSDEWQISKLMENLARMREESGSNEEIPPSGNPEEVKDEKVKDIELPAIDNAPHDSKDIVLPALDNTNKEVKDIELPALDAITTVEKYKDFKVTALDSPEKVKEYLKKIKLQKKKKTAADKSKKPNKLRKNPKQRKR